jgi:hypothetical protein
MEDRKSDLDSDSVTTGDRDGRLQSLAGRRTIPRNGPAPFLSKENV